MEAPVIMRALEVEVADAIWADDRAADPTVDRPHPLGCQRPRVPDRVCFWGPLMSML